MTPTEARAILERFANGEHFESRLIRDAMLVAKSALLPAIPPGTHWHRPAEGWIDLRKDARS